MAFIKTLATFSFLILFTSTNAQQIQEDTTAGNIVIEDIDTEASFPGGLKEWQKYLQQNLKADVAANNGAPAGRYTVMARFIVNREGLVSNIKSETKLGYGMEEEVLRVIAKSGKWNPAVQNGRLVNAYRRQPVVFVIDTDDFQIESQGFYTLYTNTKNVLAITAGKTKPEDISITVPGGKVTANGDGQFTVTINKTGSVTVEIYDTKKEKLIGTARFEVQAK